MSANKFIALLILSLVFMTSASAAVKSREFAIDFNYISVQGTSSASILNASLGQFITPQLVIVTVLTSQSNFGYTGTSIGLGGKYYFMDGFRGDLVPFAGGGLALRNSKVPVTNANKASTQYDAYVGLAYFLADSTTLDIKAKAMNYNDASPSVTAVTVGFSQRF